jgi:CBS domain-containing protein
VAELPLDKVLDFLKRVHPFSELPETALKDVVRTLLVDYFPGGETILSPSKKDVPYLYLVFSGVGHCFKENGSGRHTLRYVSQGDHVGSEVIMTGKCEYTTQVMDDMICYLVRPDVFRDLESRFQVFGGYFHTIMEPLTVQIAGHMATEGETALTHHTREKTNSSQFERTVGSLVSREPVCCGPKTTASEIARVMGFEGVGSVIVLEEGEPVGIVTKNDLTEKILARKRGADIPASQIMSTGLITMDHRGSCFEASLRMVQSYCHHMVALEGDRLFGVVSQHDLILLQGANPVAVVGAIQKQKDLSGLKKCVLDMSVVQHSLLAEGGRIEEIWSLMTTFRDRLTRRLIVLGIEEMRKQGWELPVLEFCWMTFGTVGRRETLLRRNFLEGLVYKDPEEEKTRKAETYLKGLASMVKEGLLECGLLHREGGEVLCLPVSEWRRRIMGLTERGVPLDSQNLRLFDFRGVVDEQGMVHELREYVFQSVAKRPDFIERAVARNDPSLVPICFYGDKVVFSTRRQETLGLKNEVLVPLIDAVRSLALKQGVTSFSTAGRMRALAELGVIEAQTATDLQTVFGWLVEMSLHRALDEQHGLDWILHPHTCSSEEKRLLTESFRLIRRFLERRS